MAGQKKEQQGGGFSKVPVEETKPKKAEEAVSADKAIEKLDKAAGKIKVIHGSSDEDFELVGANVASVRASLVDAFNIPADAQAFVDGEEVNENHVLQKNQTLEFVKAAGVKG